MVRLPRNLNTLRSNFAKDADCYAGARERVSHDLLFADPKAPAELSYFAVQELANAK